MDKKFTESINKKLVEITSQYYNINEGKFKTNNPNLKDLDSFHINSPSVIGIYNHISCSYDFFSSNTKSLLGFDCKKFVQGNLQFMLSLIHPNQRNIFENELLPILFKYYYLYSLKRKVTDLKFSYTVKIKRSDGNYIWILHEMRPIKTNSKGQPVYSMLTISEITGFKKDESNEMIIYKKNESGIFKKIHFSCYSAAGNSCKFSKRELEIITLLAEGKTSKKIGEVLNLSVHTISTHRKNMIEKSGVQNTTELIKMASIRGLI